MRHDAKLGLALGMLATGFAVAFCCPRQPASTSWLQTGARHPLDRSVLDLFPIKAYQPSPAAPPTSAPPSGVTAPSLRVNLGEPPPPLAPVSTVDPILMPTQDSGRSIFAPVPVQPQGKPPVESPAQTRSPFPLPMSGRSFVEIPPVPPAPTQGPVVAAPVEVREAAPAQRYVVQAGDTLSGIASRFLGSSARFQEIYQANQEVLSSPDNLQVGMVLTIPVPPESGIANSPNRAPQRSNGNGLQRTQPYQQANERPPFRR